MAAASRGLCYYDVLGLPRNADDVEVKKAFRRLAMRHHPDVDGAPDGGREFGRICEAYDVLSTAMTKGVYDLYGEEVLKSTADGGGGYSFDAASGPAAVFARFFGTANPYEALNALAAHFEKLTTKVQPQPGTPQEVELLVSLEDIAAGCSKVVSHSRQLAGEGGTIVRQQVALRVELQPGQLEGTRYVFEGEGDALTQGTPPGQLVLVLASAPHPRFRRHGPSDLAARVKLPLLTALTGGSVRLETLDGRVLSIPLDEVITPGHTMRVAGEGLPLPGAAPAADGKQLKGDLLLELQLVFPTHLSGAQKMLLAAALYLPAKPSAAAAKALRALEAAFRDGQHGWSSGVVKGAGEGGEGGAEAR